MAKLSVIHSDQYLRSTWKNGLGFTDQIAIFPEYADLRKGDFKWRISSAQIDRNSDFSLFPEHDRVLVLLKGNGLRLIHNIDGESDDVNLGLFEPYDFPGDVPSRCEVTDGSVVDLSVFIKKGEVEVVTYIVDLNEENPVDWRPEGHCNFAFAAQGTFAIQSNELKIEAIIKERSSVRLDLDQPLTGEEKIRISIPENLNEKKDPKIGEKQSNKIVFVSLTLGP